MIDRFLVLVTAWSSGKKSRLRRKGDAVGQQMDCPIMCVLVLINYAYNFGQRFSCRLRYKRERLTVGGLVCFTKTEGQQFGWAVVLDRAC